MRTTRSLTVSRSICHTRSPCHACPPCYACPSPCHASPLPHMPPCHACPPTIPAPLPCMPPAMHTPHHICPPHHAHTPATHAPPHPPMDRILDTRFWKYYLAPTSLRVVNISGLRNLEEHYEHKSDILVFEHVISSFFVLLSLNQLELEKFLHFICDGFALGFYCGGWFESVCYHRREIRERIVRVQCTVLQTLKTTTITPLNSKVTLPNTKSMYQRYVFLRERNHVN